MTLHRSPTTRRARLRLARGLRIVALAWPLCLAASVAPATGAIDFTSTWETVGSGDGELSSPFDVAADAAGNVYATDLVNNRVQKFDSSGTFLLKWGRFGSGDGQLAGPTGIATDADGNVYVADTGNDRIQKFDSDGAFIAAWGGTGSADGELEAPADVVVDASGNLYIVEIGSNSRIQKFAASGSFATKVGTSGSGNGEFDTAFGLGTDGAGTIYVADTFNNRIQKFSDLPASGDTTSPTVSLTSPGADAAFLLDEAATSDFACADEAGGSGLARCDGSVDGNPVVAGAAIDTSTLGVHRSRSRPRTTLATRNS